MGYKRMANDVFMAIIFQGFSCKKIFFKGNLVSLSV